MPDLHIRKLIPTLYIFFIALAAILSLYPTLAQAHARYERSEPAAEAVIAEPPAEVHVWFNQELFRREGANLLEVFGPDRTQVDQGDTRLDDDDRTHLIVSLQPGLLPGTYTVKWRNLSAEDGDTDNGEFSFTVDPEADQEAAPTPAGTDGSQAQPATETPAPTATPLPSPTPTPAPASQTGGGLPCFTGIALGALALMGVSPWRRKGGVA